MVGQSAEIIKTSETKGFNLYFAKTTGAMEHTFTVPHGMKNTTFLVNYKHL